VNSWRRCSVLTVAMVLCVPVLAHLHLADDAEHLEEPVLFYSAAMHPARGGFAIWEDGLVYYVDRASRFADGKTLVVRNLPPETTSLIVAKAAKQIANAMPPDGRRLYNDLGNQERFYWPHQGERRVVRWSENLVSGWRGSGNEAKARSTSEYVAALCIARACIEEQLVMSMKLLDEPAEDTELARTSRIQLVLRRLDAAYGPHAGEYYFIMWSNAGLIPKLDWNAP